LWMFPEGRKHSKILGTTQFYHKLGWKNRVFPFNGKLKLILFNFCGLNINDKLVNFKVLHWKQFLNLIFILIFFGYYHF
jgi:hypothetical protein